MREDTLMDMVDHMEDDVGLVHQMPFVCDREGFPAALEKVRWSSPERFLSRKRIDTVAYWDPDLLRNVPCTRLPGSGFLPRQLRHGHVGSHAQKAH